MLIKVERNNLSEVLKKAVAVLNDGGIVAYLIIPLSAMVLKMLFYISCRKF